jgi:hypothetical protein
MLPLLPLLLASQCGGCQALCVKDMVTGPHVTAHAQGAASFVTVDLFAVADGVCGPGIGTSCSEQVDGCDFLALVDAFSAPSEFVVLVYGSGTVVLPLGSYQQPVPIDGQKCNSYTSFDCYVFSASTLQQLDFDFARRWCRSCPKPD